MRPSFCPGFRFQAVLAALVAALPTVFAAPPAHATVALSVPLDELAKGAGAVIRGVVAQKRVFLDPKWGRISTDTTVTVKEFLAGTTDAEVIIRQFGGTLDGKTLAIPGDAVLAIGDEVVLFLTKPDDNGVRYLTNMAQSKFSVEHKSNGVRHVRREFAGLELMVRNPAGQLVSAPKESLAPLMTYEELVTIVKTARKN